MRIIIIGGGAAGLMAAALASAKGHEVTLLEKNEKTGKKLYITGKGRCNLTNACDNEEFFTNVISNPRFMYSSLYGFDSEKTIAYFYSIGLKTKTERGKRVFPESDKSSDVIRALNNELSKNGVKTCLNTEVGGIEIEDGRFKAVRLKNGEKLFADVCFVATGGLSYPSTGSTGDGYRFAKELGHKCSALLPSLVSIKTKEGYVKEAEGLSLKNVTLSAFCNNRLIYSDLGELLFTHNGISGPLVLTLSSLKARDIASGNEIKLFIDLKPALNETELDNRILKDFSENMNRNFSNSLNKLLPASIIPIIIRLSGILPQKQVNAVTKQERLKLLKLIKAFPLTVSHSGGYDEAVITRGGVSVKEINPSTMESKLVGGVYFIGEVLDVDALTGGFNLQIAWSTAAAAVNSLSDKEII